MMVRLLLPLLLVVVCAAVCICNVSHAYSTNSLYVYNNIKRRTTSLQQHISITNNDKVVLDKMGRRAFFHRGGTIISSATATAMITFASPQPAQAATKKAEKIKLLLFHLAVHQKMLLWLEDKVPV